MWVTPLVSPLRLLESLEYRLEVRLTIAPPQSAPLPTPIRVTEGGVGWQHARTHVQLCEILTCSADRSRSQLVNSEALGPSIRIELGLAIAYDLK